MAHLLEDVAVWPELGFLCSNGNSSLGQVVTVRREEFEKLKLRLPAKMGGHLALSNSYTTEVGFNFHSYFSEERVGPALYLDMNLNSTKEPVPELGPSYMSHLHFQFLINAPKPNVVPIKGLASGSKSSSDYLNKIT